MTALQYLERADHGAGAGKIGAAAIGTKFPPARIPADNHARENSEDYLRDHSGQNETNAGFRAIVLEQRPVDDAADDAREEYHEGIYHTLQQGKRNHITIRDMAYFMAQYGFYLAARHAAQQSGTHGH